MIDFVINLLENYGWYMLIVGVILFYIYSTYLNPLIHKYLTDKNERDYAAKYHKNPDLLNARLQAQEAHIQKLQSQYNKDAEEYLKKQEERKARKMQELEEKYLNGGHELGNRKDENDNKTLRPDYNPLMGSSTGSYRPPRRSACGGGGCGR